MEVPVSFKISASAPCFLKYTLGKTIRSEVLFQTKLRNNIESLASGFSKVGNRNTRM